MTPVERAKECIYDRFEQKWFKNPDYRLEDHLGVGAVIRRPPMGELLPKAHDMSREWSVISALGKTGQTWGRKIVGVKVVLLAALGGSTWTPAPRRKGPQL